MRRRRDPWGPRRSLESSAIAAAAPAFAMLPVWLLALGVFWVPVHLLWHIDFAVFAALHLLSVVLLFQIGRAHV
mgnify:FL=1